LDITWCGWKQFSVVVAANSQEKMKMLLLLRLLQLHGPGPATLFTSAV
jgi:hypothetical protein